MSACKSQLVSSDPHLTYIGEDDWNRSLFRSKSGIVVVDVGGELYTRSLDWEEPCSPVGYETPKLIPKESC